MRVAIYNISMELAVVLAVISHREQIQPVTTWCPVEVWDLDYLIGWVKNLPLREIMGEALHNYRKASLQVKIVSFPNLWVSFQRSEVEVNQPNRILVPNSAPKYKPFTLRCTW